jgi:glucose-6-phosphate isomerase
LLSVPDESEEQVEAVHSGRWRGFSGKKIKHIVNIGIGGSDVGPRMVVEALKPYRIPKIHCHFVSNVDGSVMDELMSTLNPEKTLFIIASKSFTTPETMQNAYTARQWLVSTFKSESAVASHFVAISTNSEAVDAFGINQANVFNMWDWVGGRYSLWSPIGLPIALAIGWSYFEELLQGAYKMDKHFQNEPFHNNMPVMMGLIGVYNTNFLGCQSQAVLPYDERLKYLPDHLQQLEMESNGKTCRIDGKMADYQTGYILWGQTGTNGQHAFYQLLHQGTMIIPSDFILVKKPHHDLIEHHQALLANALAQSRGLMTGKTFKQAYDELVRSGQSAQKAAKLAPHKMIPGNKPSNTIVLNQLTPSALGQLLALYEHKILVEGIIWEINSFDQWGVELGKQLAKPLNQALLFANNASNTYDCSTEGLLKYLQT